MSETHEILHEGTSTDDLKRVLDELAKNGGKVRSWYSMPKTWSVKLWPGDDGMGPWAEVRECGDCTETCKEMDQDKVASFILDRLY